MSILFSLSLGLASLSAQQSEQKKQEQSPAPPTVKTETPVNALATANSEVNGDNFTTKFSPDPMKAVWYSVLFPGLGQVYNRRYWKLPIVIGGYMGLTYATSWNSRYYTDYSRAYRDIMDSDPTTNSYMNFLPMNTSESTLDKEWLKGALKRKKDFFRRNRDLCIISMVGLYLVCIVDAYVDAQLYHFDISPDITMRINPAVMEPMPRSGYSLGLQCGITF